MDRYKVSKMEDELLDKDFEQFKDYRGILGGYKRQIWLSRIKWTTVISTGVTAVALSFNYLLEDPELEINNYMESATPISADMEPQPQEHYFDYLDTVRISNNATIAKPSVQQEVFEKKSQNDEFKFIKAVPTYSLDSALKAAQRQISLKTEKNISGTITVVMVIDASGRITDPKIISGLEPELDARVLEIISNLPPWQPASLNNKTKSSTVTIPVELSINPLK